MSLHLEDFWWTHKGSRFKAAQQKAKVPKTEDQGWGPLASDFGPSSTWNLELGTWNFLTYVALDMVTTKSQRPSDSPVPLPELIGRVAILGGSAAEKTACLVGLALRQIHRHGTVLCLDARHHQQTEVYFRLLLRQPTSYLSLPDSGEVPSTAAQAALSTVSRSLATTPPLPPLLLLDSLQETPDWERTVLFLLNAGATVVEVLPDVTALVFGRYDTVILLQEETEEAEQLSRAVGRKVSVAELRQIKPEEGVLIHRTQVYRVTLPEMPKVEGW